MTAREIIRRNLHHDDPSRIGLSFGGGRWNDICHGGLAASPTWTRKTWERDGFEYYDDEWGNVWFRVIGKSRGGEIFRPALARWEDLDGLRVPDFDNPQRYAAAAAGFAAAPDRYRLAGLPGFPFAICRYLRKMEQYLQDLILERDRIDRLHGLVTALLTRMIDRYADAGADGIFFCEDWGTQDRLLVSPAMWRDIFKPLFRRLCGRAHARGLDVLMHSCGYNWEILDDLAEVGVNCFQFDQQQNYGVARLAAKLRGLKVCLFAPLDIQKILPTGDRALIESGARELAERFRGGFIAMNYGDLHGIGVEPEWDDWAYRAFCDAAGENPLSVKTS